MHEEPLLTWRGAPGVGGAETGKCSWEFPLEGILLLLPMNRGPRFCGPVAIPGPAACPRHAACSPICMGG